MIKQICVAGAGTMGSGIAMAAAQSGYKVVLFDTNSEVLERSMAAIDSNLSFLVSKNKISVDERASVLSRISLSNSPAGCKADLIIEAIIENSEAKIDLFNRLSQVNSPSTILASNTSSLSITHLQEKIAHPERVAGMHFFNPAQVMKLVEIVKGSQTSNGVVETLKEVCTGMNKTAVVCSDSPGFIVNRVARHYYLEAMKLLEQGIASIEEIDSIMEASGFKMGPFKLMDLIGMDINLAVSRSLYEALQHEPRLQPSAIQVDKVTKGELGKKTGKGFYDYSK